MQLVDYLGRLEEKIDNLKANIAVIGLGYRTTNCSSIPQCRIQCCGGRRLTNVINSLKNGLLQSPKKLGWKSHTDRDGM